MNNSAFENFTFSVGWKTKETIVFFNTSYNITIKIKAYFETDGITLEQEKSYLEYLSKKDAIMESAESLLNQYSNNAKTHFLPATLLFERDGSCALLCNDKNNLDEGIAICISPEQKIISQDEYL